MGLSHERKKCSPRIGDGVPKPIPGIFNQCQLRNCPGSNVNSAATRSSDYRYKDRGPVRPLTEQTTGLRISVEATQQQFQTLMQMNQALMDQIEALLRYQTQAIRQAAQVAAMAPTEVLAANTGDKSKHRNDPNAFLPAPMDVVQLSSPRAIVTSAQQT